ncbi:S-adenosyl-L-methionine-dependent methyltransferase [Corynespora cassiicola Philippines]|uniref:S-adenosyl-L-methionine-dependent methyltransferase n=1 Tax=Corynespora cassiicola Philippines TaxID=1448308 RepID=A0A2T2NUW3_CORCC|nr:S-adenosyl-L-methionine-dependent methyltransferase [Corynespora cassiicola Philippines]
MSDTDENTEIVTIHDREFQKLSVDQKIYCVPVDEREEDRLASQHELIFRLFGTLFIPRISNPHKILDCGHGRGEWVVAVAEDYEECKVVGVDIWPELLSLNQPDNLALFGYNLNDRLNDLVVFGRRGYDLIHSRFVGPGIKANRWSSYVRDMKNLLKPGGWMQMMEYYPNIQSDNGRLSSESSIRRWYEGYVYAMERANRKPRIAQELRPLMEAAGLRDIRDPVQASIGRDSVWMVGELLDSLAIWPFVEHLGWTAAQVETLMQGVRAELEDESLRLYIPVVRVILSILHVYLGAQHRCPRNVASHAELDEDDELTMHPKSTLATVGHHSVHTDSHK